MKYGKLYNFVNDGLQFLSVEKKIKMSAEIYAKINTPLMGTAEQRYKAINASGFVPLIGGVSKAVQGLLNGCKFPLVHQLLMVMYETLPEGAVEEDYTDITNSFIKYGEGFGVKSSFGFNVKHHCMQSIYETYFYMTDEKMKSSNVYTMISEIETAESVYYAMIGNRRIDLLPLTGGETEEVYDYLVSYLTANSDQGYTVTCNGVYGNAANLQQYKPFAEVTGDGWQSSTVNTGWLVIDLPVAKKVTKIYTGISAVDNYFSTWINNMPKNWKFQGSNDDTTWTDLLVVTNDTARTDREFKEYVLTTNGVYKKYKFDITATIASGAQTAIGKIKLYGLK